MGIRPLEGLVVLDFSQYLSGPSAALRLADLGARVIKVERPQGGDAGRKLAIKNLWAGEDSLLFHTINRNKESVLADFNSEEGIQFIRQLVEKADVMIHNFRPGVMEKKGLGHEVVANWNPRIIYAAIAGYGEKGPWKHKPGQDLLLQSMTGLAFTTGNFEQAPVPFGVAIGDILCGAQLVQGILAALIRRQRTGKGALIEISLLESLLDFQFELLTTYYANGQKPLRSYLGNGHPLLGAPYGVYKTASGFMALAMMDLGKLATVVNSEELSHYTSDDAFEKRDEIKSILTRVLLEKPLEHWLPLLQDANLWAMEVMDWRKMRNTEAYKALKMEQELERNGNGMSMTRCPIRLNGEVLYSNKPAPMLGEHTLKIKQELNS